MTIQEQEKMLVYSKKQAQVGALLFDKAFTEVLAEYSDYSNVFSAKYAVELLDNTGMNEYAIQLEENKHPVFGLIYSLKPVELENLKTYIKINLANSFIQPFKFPTGVLILFNKKSDRSLHFYINY